VPRPVAPLEAYPLDRVWTDEARDFTPWLARSENLEQLGRSLGLGPLQFEAKEQKIGVFYLDILARDPLGHRVVIENQLKPTDHGHLGQLLTYAAGTQDGLTAVWIATLIRPEHASALRWLNAMTPPHIGFFGVEITAWSVEGCDRPGYQFRVIVRPDQLERARNGSSRDIPLREEQAAIRDYWAAFRDELTARSSQHWIRPDLPRGTWYGRNVGRSGFNFYAIIRPQVHSLAVTLEISTASHEADFAALTVDREAIDRELGGEPQWASRAARDYITTELSAADYRDRSKWPEQHAWLIEQLEKYRKVFTGRIISLATPIQSAAARDSCNDEN
jgi:Domain of unknown function (DUF4268)